MHFHEREAILRSSDPRQFESLILWVYMRVRIHAPLESNCIFNGLYSKFESSLRHAEWCEFYLDGDDPQWRILAEKMKMREQHIVPLSKQAVKLLRELNALTGNGKYLFPALTTTRRCMSENTINLALRRMGYSNEEMTGHSFRSMASTTLNEQGWHPDLIELQLAHAERNAVRAAYNKAQRLPERRKMMQAWADYLDRLREGASVVPIRRAGVQLPGGEP
jgi:Phage integrase family